MPNYNIRISEKGLVKGIEDAVANGMFRTASEFIRYSVLLALKDKSEELRLLHKAKKMEILSREK